MAWKTSQMLTSYREFHHTENGNSKLFVKFAQADTLEQKLILLLSGVDV